MEDKTDKKMNKRLAGVLILGRANLFIFGILLLIASVFAYFNITPKDLEGVEDILKHENIEKTLTISQFKTMSITQAVMSLIFIVSGWGVLSGKEWGRKITLYFAYFWAGNIILVFILHPSFINYLFIQMIYPTILILYFTHKDVAEYFSKHREIISKEAALPEEGNKE